MEELDTIKDSLKVILEQNASAEEPDQLDRNDIVLDLKSKNHQPSSHSNITLRHPSGTCG